MTRNSPKKENKFRDFLLFLLVSPIFLHFAFAKDNSSIFKYIPSFVADIMEFVPFSYEYSESRLEYFIESGQFDRANEKFFDLYEELISNRSQLLYGSAPVKWFNQSSLYLYEEVHEYGGFSSPAKDSISVGIKYRNHDYLSYLVDRVYDNGSAEDRGKLLLYFGIAIRDNNACQDEFLTHLKYFNSLMLSEPENYKRYYSSENGTKKYGPDYIREACVKAGVSPNDRQAFNYAYDPRTRYRVDGKFARDEEERRRIEQRRQQREAGEDPMSKFRAALGLCMNNRNSACQNRSTGGLFSGGYVSSTCEAERKSCLASCEGLSRGDPIWGLGGPRARCIKQCSAISCY